MKKVLILTNNAGGLYNFRAELIYELIKQGFEVYFSVPQSEEDKKVQLIRDIGAKYIQTQMNRRGSNPFEDLKLILRYKIIIKEVNPDIILTYTVKPNIYGTYAADKFNKPVIMNITGIGSSLVGGSLKNIIKKMYKYACSKAKVVFFQNEQNLNFFIENNILNHRKGILIPGSGVNVEKFIPSNKANCDGIIRFLFIGRIMKEKGIEEYIKVAEKVTKRYPNTEFQVLGSFEEENYKELIINNKNRKIKYLGRSDDVRNEIKEVDCIVHPSYHEGMSNVLLEGAAMGKPLVASNIPGCREIVEDGYNGFLFEIKSVKSLEEKVIKFIDLDEESRKIMGKNSRTKVEKEFNRDIVINEYMKTIDVILKEGQQNESI
ncbi:glycosyltransferase family 4 protein [Tepidanaerobacter acetatoxydans]|uniref:glycosyltransferase family 4 protein n=1 Tax=Tepidanaerobacter acetatoxydans TaxID=499229 RepID=UPI00020BF3BA|nr:glycosyltransferase family 4 protein [Tepidanaerobacter acetatoxydans]AEE91900.1 glycosyl transferase group 1 [Tepidanaerobacter acetatoxydans Re1]